MLRQETVEYPIGGDSVLLRKCLNFRLRALLERGAPCYVAVPGRVYRQEALDATHTGKRDFVVMTVQVMKDAKIARDLLMPDFG